MRRRTLFAGGMMVLLASGVNASAVSETVDRAWSQMKQGNHARALVLAERAREREPEDRALRTRIAAIFLEAGDPEASAEVWELLVEEVPDNADYWHNYGLALGAEALNSSTLGGYFLVDDITDAFETAVSLDPERIDSRKHLINVYMVEALRDEETQARARKHAMAIMALDRVEGHIAHGTIFRHLGEMDKVVEEYEKALAIDPDHRELWYRLGLLRQEREEFDAAMEAFSKGASTKDSAGLRAMYQIGRTAVFSGRFLEDGERALLRYIEAGGAEDGPSVAHAHRRLGMIYEHMDRKTRARAHYERALELDPENEDAREALAALGA